MSTSTRGGAKTAFDPRLSAEAKEFVPRFSSSSSEVITEEHYNDFEGTSVDYTTLHDYMNYSLITMTADPASFELHAEEFLSLLESINITDEKTLHFIADIIFSFGLAEPNFHYSGSRLCDFLSHQLSVSFGPRNFHYFLLQRCNEENRAFKETLHSDPARAHNFALFAAELYVHLTVQQGSMTLRIAVLAQCVRQVLETLLQDPNPGNVKCFMQISKLCGAFLEEDSILMNQSSTLQMDQLFDTLRTVMCSERLPPHLKRMLRNVYDLRASNWGQGAVVPGSSSSEAASFFPNSVFESVPLTSEETAFLAGEDLQPCDQEEDWYGDTGLDPEIEAEFEKFLASEDS